MQLEFSVKEQTLTFDNNEKNVIEKSQNYLTAKFSFFDDWKDIVKTAVFISANGDVYNQILDENGVCNVPWEVIDYPHFSVSVFGGDRITANKVVVNVGKSGYNLGDTSRTPTPDPYKQLAEDLGNEIDEVSKKVTEEITNINKNIDDINKNIDDINKSIDETNKNLQKYIEDNTIYNTAFVHDVPLYDLDITKENKGIKAMNFYGYTRQAAGTPSIKSPCNLIYPEKIDTVTVVNDTRYYRHREESNYYPYPFLATNNYRDEGIFDFEDNKLKITSRIKKIVLDGTEGTGVWAKASSPDGRYYANLYKISGLFTDEDKVRMKNGTKIAYDDALCTIANTYVNSTPASDGEFRIIQGLSTSTGEAYFRFEFFTSECATLAEVLSAVQNKPITILIPMIYDVKQYDDYNLSVITKAISEKFTNSCCYYFTDYNMDYSLNHAKCPTEITYIVNVGLSLQNIKNAIATLGGI